MIVKCNVCDNQAVEVNKFKLLGLIESSTFRCTVCNSYFRDPLPNDEQLFYYYSQRHNRYSETVEQSMAKIQAEWLETSLLSVCTDKSVIQYIEFGCGRGWLVKEMIDRGFDAIGLDPDRNSIEWGKKNLNIDIQQGFLEIGKLGISALSTKTIYIVSLMHVFEHLRNTQQFLKDIKSISTNLFLFLEVPDGKHEGPVIGYDTLSNSPSGQHFTSFTVEGLKTIMVNGGYEIIKIHTAGKKGYWENTIRSLKLWNFIDTRVRKWSEIRFSFDELFFSGIRISFCALGIWVYSRIKNIFVSYDRVDLPIIRIFAQVKK